MAAFLQSATEKALSLFGYDKPSSNALWVGKIAIVGGVIGVSALIAYIPITISFEKEIKIRRSGKQVYDFLSETPANTFWPSIHPFTVSAEVKEEFNNTQNVMITDDYGDGQKYSFLATITKQSRAQIIELDTTVHISPFIYGIQFNMVMQVINQSNTQCTYKNVIKERVPLFMVPTVKRMLNIVWGDGTPTVASFPLAIKDAVEDAV
eukprot:99170_1